MNANMKRLLILALVPVTVWGIGSTYTAIKADRIAKNTESQITMSDTVRFSSGTATTVPYLDANKDFVSSSVTPTELGYLSGVTSGIQAQLGTKTDTGTINEITLSDTTIGLADNAIFPGTGAVTLPSGTTEQQPSEPIAGMIRYNLDNASFEGYTTDWGAIGGGGAGGSRLQLFDDASFESGVANGACTGCTASQETSVVLATTESALNAASLKMAFSAASGDYTWTETTGAQYSNVAGKVSAWIKTSASDCHFVEMVDGAESQTVAISSNDEWKEYIINGTMGTTSYGYRVECNTSITDDVYVDETYAGAATADTFDIGTASLWGSVKWSETTGCFWADSTASFSSFSATAACDDNARTIRGQYVTTSGDAANSDGQIPKITFSYMPAGEYVVVMRAARMYKNTSVTTNCAVRFTDGTNTTSPVMYGTSGATETQNPITEGSFYYSTPQSNVTIQPQMYTNSGGNCGIYLADGSGYNGLELSVYHYPSPQKVVAAKCDGLECENTFSTKVSATGVESEVSHTGWIDCSAAGSDFTCDMQAGLFSSSPVCAVTVDSANSGGNVFIEKLDNDELDYQTTSYTSTGGIALPVTIICSRGSDYKQFDQRMVRVIQEEDGDNWTAYTPTFSAGLGTVSNIDFFWKKDGSDMLIRGRYTTGTTTAGEIQIGLPSGYTSDDVTGTIAKVGEFDRESAWTNEDPVVTVQDNVTYMTYGFSGSGNAYSTKVGGSSIGSSQTFMMSARVPIQGWKKDVNAFIGNLTPKEFVQTPGSTKPVTYSAKIATSGTVSLETGTFINGNCTNADPQVCTFETGAFSQEPVCQMTALHESYYCGISGISSGSVTFRCKDFNGTSSTNTVNKVLTCHGVQ